MGLRSQDLIKMTRAQSEQNLKTHRRLDQNTCKPKWVESDGIVVDEKNHHQLIESNDKDTYLFHGLVGEGGSAKIFLCAHKPTGRQVVIKRMRRIPDEVRSCSLSQRERAEKVDRDVLNEVEALSILRGCPAVVDFDAFFQDDDFYYLVMEFVEGMDLYEHLGSRQPPESDEEIESDNDTVRMKPLSESEVRPIFRKIVLAVQQVHQHGIAHLDLKLENVMLTKNNEVKLIDFGLCEFISNNIQKRRKTNEGDSTIVDAKLPVTKWVGSMEYVAPEVVQRIPYDGEKADVWCLGTLLFILLQGKYPFPNHKHRFYSLQILNSHPPLLFNEELELEHNKIHNAVNNVNDASNTTTHANHIDNTNNSENNTMLSEDAKYLLRRMLDTNPTTRISIHDILNHPWPSTQ